MTVMHFSSKARTLCTFIHTFSRDGKCATLDRKLYEINLLYLCKFDLSATKEPQDYGKITKLFSDYSSTIIQPDD